jgi:hypothetical protein
MREAVNGADKVVHNARQYEFRLDKAGKQHMRSINVTGTDNVLGWRTNSPSHARYFLDAYRVFQPHDAAPSSTRRALHPLAQIASHLPVHRTDMAIEPLFETLFYLDR